MAQSPAPENESRPPHVSKSWLDLKWNNPENTNRLGRTSRSLKKCSKCRRACKRNADCFLCTRLGKVSKQYPKLSVKTTEKAGTKPSEAEAAGLEESSIENSRKYRQHWWRCNGPCRDKMPHLGVIRRSTTRPPGPTDKWWSDHVKTCGGAFVKVQNPELVPKTKNQNNSKNGDIRNFLSIASCSGTSDSSAVSSDVSVSTIGETDASFHLEADELSKSLSEIRDDVEAKLLGDNCSKSKKDTSFQSKENEELNSLLEICDGVEAKLQNKANDRINSSLLDICDRVERKLQNDNCKTEEKDTLFQSDEDEELNNILLEICDDVEAKLQGFKCCKEEELVSCLACGVQIFKTQLDSHLVVCMNDIFEVEVEDNVKQDNLQFSCPLCMKSVSESDLKEHTEFCSSTADSTILFSDE